MQGMCLQQQSVHNPCGLVSPLRGLGFSLEGRGRPRGFNKQGHGLICADTSVQSICQREILSVDLARISKPSPIHVGPVRNVDCDGGVVMSQGSGVSCLTPRSATSLLGGLRG